MEVTALAQNPAAQRGEVLGVGAKRTVVLYRGVLKVGQSHGAFPA